MPNNENNFELPKENKEPITNSPMPNNPNSLNQNMPQGNQQSMMESQTNNQTNLSSNNETNTNKPIIEIPQSYYDKIAQENQQKALEEEKKNQAMMEQQIASDEAKGLLGYAILNAALIFGLMYATVNINIWLFFGIPIGIIAMSLIIGFKNKEKSTYPSSVMVGGIVCAVISFLLSMTNEDTADLYMYYSIANAVLGFLGYAISSIITKYTYDAKNIKALQTLGYLLFFIALIGVPYYIATNHREEFFKYFTRHQVDIKAETEEEFVAKTMKARYNISYTCDTIKHYIDEQGRKEVVRSECYDSKHREFTITSRVYNEGQSQYVVKDTYLDTVVLDPIKKTISDQLKASTSASNVRVSLYPEENCYFYGDCVDCDEYHKERSKLENDINVQYETSTSINFEKYLTADSKKFLNDNKFKYFINIYGSLNSNAYPDLINNVLDTLNSNGYKNNYGFIINLYNVIGGSGEDGFEVLVYKAIGQTNSAKEFTDFKEGSISAPTK